MRVQWHRGSVVLGLTVLSAYAATPPPRTNDLTTITVLTCGQNFAPALMIGRDALDLEVPIDLAVSGGRTTIIARTRVVRGVTTALEIAKALGADFDHRASALGARVQARVVENTVIIVGGATHNTPDAPGWTGHGPAEPYLHYFTN